MKLDDADKNRLRDLFITQLQQCEQVCSNSSTAAMLSQTGLRPVQLLILVLHSKAICCLVLTHCAGARVLQPSQAPQHPD